MTERQLPEGFAELEPWVDDWALASRPERSRSFGSGGSWSDGLTRCQISVKIRPASRPPATLVAICSGMYMALDTALMASAFP